MCGIVCVLNSNTDINYQTNLRAFFRQALICDALRGEDGTGVAHISKNEIEIIKKPWAGYDFVQHHNAALLLYSKLEGAWIGHNRKATHGGKAYTHPFEVGDITLVHNGMIDNYKQLSDECNPSNDSLVITELINKNGAKATIESMLGAWALVWYDSKDKRVHMCRNDKRPLFFAKVKDKNTHLICSEYGMLVWLASRNGIELDKVYSVTENTIFTFLEDFSDYTTEKVTERKPQEIVIHKGYHRTVSNDTYIQRSVAEILQEIGLSLHQEIVFTYEEWAPYNKSRDGAGILYGCDLSNNINQIVCHNVFKPYKNGRVKKALELGKMGIKGKIVNAKYDKAIGNILYVVDASVVPMRKGKNVRQNNNNNNILGPNGEYISHVEYDKLTSSGCDNCGCNLLDPKEVHWANGFVFCKDCSAIYGVMGV